MCNITVLRLTRGGVGATVNGKADAVSDIEIGENAPILEVMSTMRAMRRLRPDPVPEELLTTWHLVLESEFKGGPGDPALGAHLRGHSGRLAAREVRAGRPPCAGRCPPPGRLVGAEAPAPPFGVMRQGETRPRISVLEPRR
jgi:hypothetical protein